MRTIRLYTEQSLQTDATLILEDGPASHLTRVLRAREGDSVTLFNGLGWDWSCTVAEVSKRETRIAVGRAVQVDNESPLSSHLGLCLSKGERFDWAIQKATEMGVASITPLFSARVDVKLPADRLTKKQRHWQQIAISACEQSGRAVVPVVKQATDLSAWALDADADLKLVLHHHNPARLTEVTPNSVALLIGPEGGLTEQEVEHALSAGFQALQLGPRVMRTETAPIAALAVLGSRWGDL